MKNFNLLSISAMILFILSIQSCSEQRCERELTYMRYTPIYKTLEEIRSEIRLESSRDLCNPGKMFLNGHYIYVNDIGKGIHIINNSNPSSPSPIGFINIPGNVDIAVKNNTLYADNYADLEFFDVSNPQNPIWKGRVEEVFESILFNEDLGQVVGYEEQEVTETYDCNNFNSEIDFIDVALPVNADINSFDNIISTTATSAPQAIAGSLSRFATFGNNLYVIDDQINLDIFDISNECDPIYLLEFNVGWGIETLFPAGGNLFIGAEDGLYIYNLDNPTAPTFQSKFEHARACDPVFVQENTAYVTLRSGNECLGFENQLDILDVTDISNPDLLVTVDLDNPHGLSLKDDLLFICEGEFGFKIFDKSDLDDIANRELSHLDNFTAFDVIALPRTNTAMVVGQDGLFQYDFSNAENPTMLSLIPATRECTF